MSYTRENVERLEAYTPGFQPSEPGFVKLNTNENPYPPSQRVLEALREACGEEIRKYPDPLATEFRLKAAEVLGTKPERIICGFGSDDLLNIAVRTFCGEGDVVAFPYPTYSLCEVLADIQNARGVSIDFPEDFSLPLGFAKTGARLVMISNPNSPSGTMIERGQFATLARELDSVLLIDEAYVDFAEWNCLELADTMSNVIVTRTLSKSHSLAGLRFGYAVADEKLIEGMMKVKDSYNVSRPAIAGATAAIADHAWLSEITRRINSTRERLMVELEKVGFFCWPSQANVVLARVPTGRDAEWIYEELFARKILIRYFKKRRLEDCLRISIGTDREIDALLSALREMLK